VALDAADRLAIERDLAAIEAAVLDGDPAAMTAATGGLWQRRRQVPEVVTERLAAGRSRLPELALDLLGGFAGARQSRWLRQLAEDAGAPDIVRLRARRRLPWPERGEERARLAFLATLRQPEAALARLVAEAEGPLPLVEDLQEALRFYLALPGDGRRRLLAAIGERAGDGEAWRWLLRGLIHVPEPEVQLALLRALLAARDGQAVGSVARLARTAGDATVRREAAATAARLGMAATAPGRSGPDWAWREQLPLRRLVVTCIDGEGAQAAIALRGPAGRSPAVMDVVWRDDWGARGAFGKVYPAGERLEEIAHGFAAHGVPTVDLTAAGEAAAAALLAAMEEATVGAGRPWLPTFELWVPLLAPAAALTGAPAAAGAATLELDDAPFRGRERLRAQAAELLAHPFFQSWHLAGKRLQRLLRRPEPRIDALLPALLGPEDVARLRRRLRRQAWLLDRAGDGRARDLALAAAAGLDGASGAALNDQPLLRAMLARTLAAG
jgi:hypothetical protein